MKKLRITVEGKVYEVSVEILDEGAAAGTPPQLAPVASAPVASAPVASVRMAAPAASARAVKSGGEPDVVASSLAGKVVSLQVSVGQEVQQGQELITIEAMKMNTLVYSPKAGKVAEIFVSPGDAVEEGQGLIKIA